MPIKQRFFLTGIITGILLVTIWLNANANPHQQTPPLPTDGWRVCQDLGVGSVPGLGEDRQRFVLCNPPTGWQVQVYCLNPGVTPPGVGAYCSLVSGNTFWCGDTVQQLELYGILQIPPTPTATATATNTATPTATALPPTATLQPSQTPPPAATQAPTVIATAVVRVAPGGPGNLGVISIGILFSSALLAGAVILARRQSRSR